MNKHITPKQRKQKYSTTINSGYFGTITLFSHAHSKPVSNPDTNRFTRLLPGYIHMGSLRIVVNDVSIVGTYIA